MKVENVKLNRATNSSSSHSIIMVGSDHNYENEEPDTMWGGGLQRFGWENFVLASPGAKEVYLAQMFRGFLRGAFDPDLATVVAEAVFDNTHLEREGYVDHNSTFGFPTNWHRMPVDMEFLADLRKYVARDDVVIFGGNDNEGDDWHPEPAPGAPWVPLDRLEGTCVARKDGKHWTVFNRANGARFTFSFETMEAMARPATPMLVEVSITDRCESECQWCYRSCTRNGEHAILKDLINLAPVLQDMKVFEVCLGGGEPTLHPGLADALGMFHWYGINTNFTTAKPHQLSNDLVETIKKTNTGVGVSISWMNRPSDVVKKFSEYGILDKLTLHVIDTLTSRDMFDDTLQISRQFQVPVLVLGYKSVGRGAIARHVSPGLWPQMRQHLQNGNRIAVDTSFAAANISLLHDVSVPRYLYEIKDGRYNCFIDAVHHYMAKSSYETTTMVRTGPDYRNSELLREAWQGLGGIDE